MTFTLPKGSIPVHTGKPQQLALFAFFLWVYPRTHGETIVSANTTSYSKGLSPYTRGNRLLSFGGNFSKGSIPVHTGKPEKDAREKEVDWVYPRTHGETILVVPVQRLTEGLSPYTRGNHRVVAIFIRCPGSIPVHTGKPMT